jgi:hypothetical protein
MRESSLKAAELDVRRMRLPGSQHIPEPDFRFLKRPAFAVVPQQT